MKRLIDIVAAAAALLLLSPVFITVAALVIAASGFPIFFKQRRIGKDFHAFWLWKFRTMRTDSAGTAITVSGDFRVTRIGRILRAMKLDEIPQFWNVLRGDMSLVGPRPELPEYVNLFRNRYRSVLTVRPGITDLASIRFRNEEDVLAKSAEPLREYVEKILPAKLDVAEEYVRTHTILGDVSILLRTATAVLRQR